VAHGPAKVDLLPQFMSRLHTLLGTLFVALPLGGCATRPVNPPITRVDPNAGYRIETRLAGSEQNPDLVVLAFSGGGTRAGRIIMDSPDFQRRLKDIGARIVPPAAGAPPPAPAW